MDDCNAYVMATKTKMPDPAWDQAFTPEERELLAALRAAEAKGEDPVGALYEALSPEGQRAFVQRRTA